MAEYPTDNVRRQWERLNTGGGEAVVTDECDCCECISVQPNMVHPVGNFPTVRHWNVRVKRSSTWETATDGSGEVSLSAGTYRVVWNDASGKWEGTIPAASIQFRDNNGVVATPQSVSGTIIMDWLGVNDLYYVDFTFDAVGGPNPVPI